MNKGETKKINVALKNVRLESDGTTKNTNIFINDVKQTSVTSYELKQVAGKPAYLTLTYN